jgi:integrase/recombinase XerD
VELVKRPKVDADHSDTQGLSKDQARALLAAARADGPRSHALVSLLLFTGIRLSEALNASTTDYGHDTGHRTLSIRRKGGKDAKVAVPAPAVEALNAYLGTTGRELVAGMAGGGLPIFTTATGKRWASSEAFRTVQRLARVAEVEGKIPARAGKTNTTDAIFNNCREKPPRVQVTLFRPLVQFSLLQNCGRVYQIPTHARRVGVQRRCL